jgi:hypothetical protein
MKKYLLSLHGKFDTMDLCKDIASTLTPIVDSKKLKFSHRHSNMLFCFESEVDQIEIHDYIQGSLFGLFDYFILSVVGDNLSVCMDKETSGHLFDTENEGKNVDMSIDMAEEITGRRSNTEEDGDDFVAEIISELKWRIKKPSVDEILDKIRDRGINSISQYEKDILDNFGK